MFLLICLFIMYTYHISAFCRYIIINYSPSVATVCIICLPYPSMEGNHQRSNRVILSAEWQWHCSGFVSLCGANKSMSIAATVLEFLNTVYVRHIYFVTAYFRCTVINCSLSFSMLHACQSLTIPVSVPHTVFSLLCLLYWEWSTTHVIFCQWL